MEGQSRTDDIVRVPANGREQFYDSRGYGRPAGDALDLAPVEAAHLLYRGDLDSVDGRGFREYLSAVDGLAVRFLVYKDLRDRGFYCSPTREGWSEAVDPDDTADFLVYPRGKGPWDEVVEHRVHVVGERTTVAAAELDGGVLAVVDEESEITYLDTRRAAVEGDTDHEPPAGVAATLLGDRVVAWDPPESLYEQGFYGQPLDRDDDALQLSLVEAAYLAERGALDVQADDRGDGHAAVLARGREAEGGRFDRRLTVYTTLRDRGVVPKTGFKFGADFRTYAEVESVEELGHSELLVRVLPGGHTFAPRDLALDVRLAHGVRKEMVFALVDSQGEDAAAAGGTADGPDIEWLRVQRLTP